MEVLRRAQGHADEKLWSKILNFFWREWIFFKKKLLPFKNPVANMNPSSVE